MALAFFDLDEATRTLHPRALSTSLWSEKQMHGVAISSALAWAAEERQHQIGRTELQPTRFSVDMFKPALMVPTTIETNVVREGRRLALVDATMLQDGIPVARASALFLKPGGASKGRAWAPDDVPEPPPLSLVSAGEEPHVPWYKSDSDWSQEFLEHQDAGRKFTWQTGIPVVSGVEATLFTSVAGIADGSNMVTNWGTAGVEFINSDIAVTLARLPESRQLGLAARDRVEHDGIVTATAVLFDRLGPIGTTLLTGIANADRTVTFESVTYTDDGERQSSPRA